MSPSRCLLHKQTKGAAGGTSEGHPAGFAAAAGPAEASPNLWSVYSTDVSPRNHNLHKWERPHQHFTQHTGGSGGIRGPAEIRRLAPHCQAGGSG